MSKTVFTTADDALHGWAVVVLVVMDDIYYNFALSPLFAWLRLQMETVTRSFDIFFDLRLNKRSALLALCEGNHQSPVDSPHKNQVDFFIRAWTNDWANNQDAGNLRSHRAHFDVIVMWWQITMCLCNWWTAVVNFDTVLSYCIH